MSYRRAIRFLSLVIAFALAASLAVTAAPAANAESPSIPATVTVSPVTGLVDGSQIAIHADAIEGYAIFGLTARLCAASASINLADDFAPSKGGYCISTPLSAGSDAKTVMATTPPNISADLTFRVGVGQETFNTQYGDTVTIGCGPAQSACKLVLEFQVSGTGAAGNLNGKVYKSFALDYAGIAVVPDAPVNVVAVPGNESAVVTWSVPPSDGGDTITGYTVTATPSGRTCPWTSGPLTCTVTGLTNNTPYTFQVVATNGIGTGAQSTPSSSVTPVPPATVPGAPTGVIGVAGNTKVTVSWSAPSNNGGSPVTGYTATASPSGRTCVTATTSCTVTGLTNGTSYTFTVKASNLIGPGSSSSASSGVIPATTKPGPPTAVVGTVGNAQVSFTWAAPLDNGGASVTAYTVTAFTSGGVAVSPAKTCSPASVSTRACTITGLTNGTDYKFSVTATNARGTSDASGQTGLLRPLTVPGAPTGLTGTVGDSQVSFTWAAPASTGGSAITAYTVTTYTSAGSAVSPANTCSPASVSTRACTISGLTNGTAYTFKVTATNAAGTSDSSTATSPLTPRTTPGAPTALVGSIASSQVSFTWSAPASTGGSAITAYTVKASNALGVALVPAKTCSPASLSTLSCSITGLTNGTAYTFVVYATNAAGIGTSSTATPSLTPCSCTAPGAPTALVGTVGNSQVSFTWTAPASTGGTAITAYAVTAYTSTGTAVSPAKTCSPASVSTRACTITGLTNGTAYTFKVVATNAVGSGTASTATGLLTPRTVPGAPSSVTAALGSAGSRLVTVAWTAPSSNGGSAITGYTVTAYTGGNAVSPAKTCTTSTATTLTCQVTGLTAGTSYTFKVVATNLAGSGVASNASSMVTAR